MKELKNGRRNKGMISYLTVKELVCEYRVKSFRLSILVPSIYCDFVIFDLIWSMI